MSATSYLMLCLFLCDVAFALRCIDGAIVTSKFFDYDLWETLECRDEDSGCLRGEVSFTLITLLSVESQLATCLNRTMCEKDCESIIAQMISRAMNKNVPLPLNIATSQMDFKYCNNICCYEDYCNNKTYTELYASQQNSKEESYGTSNTTTTIAGIKTTTITAEIAKQNKSKNLAYIEVDNKTVAATTTSDKESTSTTATPEKSARILTTTATENVAAAVRTTSASKKAVATSVATAIKKVVATSISEKVAATFTTSAPTTEKVEAITTTAKKAVATITTKPTNSATTPGVIEPQEIRTIPNNRLSLILKLELEFKVNLSPGEEAKLVTAHQKKKSARNKKTNP